MKAKSIKSFLAEIMETLERVRSGGRMPLLILGEAGGRWERFRTEQEENLGEVGRWQRLGDGEDEWSDVSRENMENQSSWETDEKSKELDIRATVTVRAKNDHCGHPRLKPPEYSKAPARIKSKTASPRIFSGRVATSPGSFLLRFHFSSILNKQKTEREVIKMFFS